MEDLDDGEPSLVALLNASKSSLSVPLSLASKDASRRSSPTGEENGSQNDARARTPLASTPMDESARDESNISKVEKSWYLISNKLDQVGLVFFLRMFKENPDLLDLFPFSDGGTIKGENGLLQLNQQARIHVKAHGRAVMRVVGTCVAGLTRIEELVPKLRHIGATHRQVGVQDMHYDILFHHLVGTIRDEIGPENWDQETEEAWEQAYGSITNLIKRPSRRLETEPLEGWGIAMAVACVYFMIVTPFRLAGFSYGRAYVEICFDILDACAALLLATDLFIDMIQTKLRLRRMSSDMDNGRKSRRETLHRGLVRQRRSIVQLLHSRGMNRWVPWPTNDLKVLLSFPLQYAYRARPGIGLHWTHLIALVRVSTAARVFHFLQCAENKALFEQKLDKERQMLVRIAKLLLRLFLVTHLAACAWCIVARFEMGADAQELTSSSFFPNTEILFGSMSVVNSYIRAIHWAFVNLSGIGDVDSTPVTTIECFITILTHAIGAIFYAIVTGNVIEMVEAASDRENKIGTDIAKLTVLMDTAKVSEVSKDRIMKGYMMRNVLTQAKSSASQQDDGLDLHDEVLNTLPSYLRQEMAIYARASLLRRRDQSFRHCSNSFLVALSSSLSGTRTLLTGDYLMQRGEKFDREFIMVESGSLQVRLNSHTIKTLERGDVIGKGWLLHAKGASGADDFSEHTDWCRSDGTAGLSIRALSPCMLLTGLSNSLDIGKLESGYKVDFDFLRAEARGSLKDDGERRMNSMKGVVRAVERFKYLKRSSDMSDEGKGEVEKKPKSS